MGRDLIVVYFERDLGGNEWLHEYKEYMDEEVDKYFASFERVVDGQKLRKVSSILVWFEINETSHIIIVGFQSSEWNR